MKRQRLSTLIPLLLLSQLFISPIHAEEKESLFDNEPNFGASINTKTRNNVNSKSRGSNSPKSIELEEDLDILDFGDEKEDKVSPSSRSLFASGSERHEVVQRPYSSLRDINEESRIGQYAYKKNRDGAIVGQSTDGKNTQIIINLNHEPKSFIYEKLKDQKKSLFNEELTDSYGRPLRENDFFNPEGDEIAGPPSPPPDAPFNLYSEYQYSDEEKTNFDEYLDSYDDLYSYTYSGDNKLSADDFPQSSYLPPSSDSFDIEDTRLPSQDREAFEIYQSTNTKTKKPSIERPSSPKFQTPSQSPPKRKKSYKSNKSRPKSPSTPVPSSNKSEEPLKSKESIVSPPSPPSPSSNESNEAESSYSAEKIKPALIGPPAPPSSSETQYSNSIYTSNQDPSRRGIYFSPQRTSQDFSTSFSPVSTIRSFPSSSFSSFRSAFPSSSSQNAPTITRTVNNLPSTFSSPSSVTYTSRILPQSQSNSFPSLPIPPPLPSSTFFSQPTRSFVSSTFNSPNFVGPPAPPGAIISPPSPPTIISPPSPPTIISPPLPPTIISPPSPPIIISPPKPPTIISPPSPPTVISVTTQNPIIKEIPKVHYNNYRVPNDITLQLQIVHRTTPQPRVTSNANVSISLNQTSITRNEELSNNRPTYKTRNDDTPDQRRPSSNNIEYHVHVNSVEQLAEITRLFGRNPLSSSSDTSKNIINLNPPFISSTLSQQRTPGATSSYELPQSNDQSILRDSTYEAPNPRDNSNSPTYETPQLRFPSDTRPTYEAPLSQTPPRPTYEAPLLQTPPRPTYEAPRLQSPLRPTYKATGSQSPPLRSPRRRRPSYYPPRRSPRQQSPQRTSKSNYSGGRNVRTALSSPRNTNRNPSKLQEILKFKCVFLCHLRQVEYQDDTK
ncbi:unnamed protein product [Lepeophtheirus salmonis]|uniref:(salmon louse) hypothetical protein n=1 Tax=Lepeophtheirus salmonis TaxID=72036 RepID=A0A7R8HBV5_LEPSM|nr:unnamed protein product [Lepeophtheirus salmonis]CAF3001740.1 unnamed protein product [Lepeophtheirus salmonis]